MRVKWARAIVARAAWGILFATPIHTCVANAAAISHWNTDNSGSFETASNWDNGVPGSADTAIFDRGAASYVVQFGTDVTNDRARFASGTVTLQPTGTAGTYVLTSPANSVVADRGLIIATTTGQSAMVNTYLPNLRAQAASVADSAGSTGSLNVLGGTLLIGLGNSTTQVDVGRAGDGTMTVLNGAKVNIFSGSLVVASETGSVGKVEVAGTGSTIVPREGILLIGASGTGTVNVHDGGSITGMSIVSVGGDSGTGEATVTGAGSLISCYGSTSVGNGGTGMLKITNGAQFTTGSAGVGNSGGALLVSGAGSKLTVTTVDLNVGRFGTGIATISDGGQVQSDGGSVGGGVSGTVTVTNVGSLWSSTNTMTVGDSGKMSITAGGQVTNTAGIIGDVNGTRRSGAVIVDGQGSSWTNSGALSIKNRLPDGSTEAANLLISNGGKVSSTTATIGGSISRRGSVIVDGLGSQWLTTGAITNGGTITVRNQGQLSAGGLLTVNSLGLLNGDGSVVGAVKNDGVVSPGNSPGILTISGSYLQSSTGILQIELSGLAAGTQYDRLVVTSDANLGGTLQISLINGFQPTAGDKFDLLDWGTRSNAFSTVQLPTLASGLSWNTASLYVDGSISVVPEPGGFALCVCAIPLLMRLRCGRSY